MYVIEKKHAMLTTGCSIITLNLFSGIRYVGTVLDKKLVYLRGKVVIVGWITKTIKEKTLFVLCNINS